MKIWCLFSITYEYDQPPNNLEAWWVAKPTKDMLIAVIGTTYGYSSKTTALQNTLMDTLLNKGEIKLLHCADYRLVEVEEGVI